MRITDLTTQDTVAYNRMIFGTLTFSLTSFATSFATFIEWGLRIALLIISLIVAIRALRTPKLRRVPRRFRSTLPLLVAVAALSGCSSLIPSEHTEQAAVKTAGELAAAQDASFTRRVEGAVQPLTVNSSGSSKVDLHLEPTSSTLSTSQRITADAAGHDSAWGLSSVKIPEGVKLLLLALGLGLLVWVLKWVINSSASGKAAFATADTILANRIAHLHEQAARETSPSALNHHLSSLASAQADRAALAVQTKGL